MKVCKELLREFSPGGFPFFFIVVGGLWMGMWALIIWGVLQLLK